MFNEEKPLEFAIISFEGELDIEIKTNLEIKEDAIKTIMFEDLLRLQDENLLNYLNNNELVKYINTNSYNNLEIEKLIKEELIKRDINWE